MWNEIKNDKCKSMVVVLGIIVFVVGIVVTGFIAGNTYALNADYYCPLDEGLPVYIGSDEYYCSFDTVSIPSSSFDVGDSVKDDADCKEYLNELGYTQITSDVGYYCTYAAVRNSCYVCSSNNSYEWSGLFLLLIVLVVKPGKWFLI